MARRLLERMDFALLDGRTNSYITQARYDDALKVLAGDEVMKFLRLSLVGAMDALQAPADPSSVAGARSRNF